MADDSIFELGNSFAICSFVSPLQSNLNSQILFFRFFTRRQDTADSRSVNGNRFLHEDVLARFDRSFKVLRAEAGWSGKNHHVHIRRQHLLITIKADKLPLGRHEYFCFMLFFAYLQRFVQPIRESICDRVEFRLALVGVHRMARRAGAAVTCSDKPQFDSVSSSWVSRPGERQPRCCCDGSENSAGRDGRGAPLQKLSTRLTCVASWISLVSWFFVCAHVISSFEVF